MIVVEDNQVEYDALVRLPIRDYVLRVKSYVGKAVRARERAAKMKQRRR